MTETTTTTLVEFLTERLDEDEALARADAPNSDPTDAEEDAPGYYDRYFAAIDLHQRQPHGSQCAWRVGEGLDTACSCGYPARVLRQVEAHRAIVALHSGGEDFTGGYCPSEDGRYLRDECPTLLALATAYTDHQDYRDEWKP